MTARGARDNFSRNVLKILCHRAGGKCCKCGATTLGPHSKNPSQAISIGRGAHIAAAAPGGPRYDPTMSPEERSSATNGLWLCCNCHDYVDKEINTFTTSRLRYTKKQHENRIRKDLGVAATSSVVTPPNSFALTLGVSSAVIVEIRKTKAHFLESVNGHGDHTQEAREVLCCLSYIDVETDEYCQEVGWELVLLYHQVVGHCQDPEVSLEVIRGLKAIGDRYQDQLDRRMVQLLCDVVRMALQEDNRSELSRVFQSCLAVLKDVSLYPSLRKKSLHHLPQQTLKKMTARDDMDGMEEEESKETSHREKEYLRLMTELLEVRELEKTLEIEQQLEDLGFICQVN